MAGVTDPAEEFALLCKRLGRASNEAGADWLAKNFETEPWSHEFYQILFTIVDRAHYLKRLANEIPHAEHIAPQINGHLDRILIAFRAQTLGGTWKSHGHLHLSAENVSPIFVFSGIVRPHVSYPSLDAEERGEIIDLVAELLAWLEAQQLSEMDFVRQAIIDGLKQFQFRIERVQWLGWGYSLQALKDVIGAYLALERGFIDDGSMPVAEAMLKKVGIGLRQIYQKAGVAKDATETAGFLLKAYGAASLYLTAQTGGLAGLLTFSG